MLAMIACLRTRLGVAADREKLILVQALKLMEQAQPDDATDRVCARAASR